MTRTGLDIAEGELKQVKDRKDAMHIFRGSRIRSRRLLISAFGGRCSGVIAWLERSGAASISLSSWMEAAEYHLVGLSLSAVPSYAHPEFHNFFIILASLSSLERWSRTKISSVEALLVPLGSMRLIGLLFTWETR
jgi:hypothetical protein